MGCGGDDGDSDDDDDDNDGGDGGGGGGDEDSDVGYGVVMMVMSDDDGGDGDYGCGVTLSLTISACGTASFALCSSFMTVCSSEMKASSSIPPSLICWRNSLQSSSSLASSCSEGGWRWNSYALTCTAQCQNRTCNMG